MHRHGKPCYKAPGKHSQPTSQIRPQGVQTMNYNKSEIMKRAWNDYKMSRGYEWARSNHSQQA